MKCSNSTCKKEAVCAPRICVPAEGVPIDLHKPISMVASLYLCDEHFDSLDVELFIVEPVKELLRGMSAEMGKLTPDFKRAFITRCALNHPHFTALMERREARKEVADAAN